MRWFAHMRAIGAITIGQAPRDDVVPEMEKLLGGGARVLQAGALDGLSRADIAALAPADGEDALITRLTDGSDVIVAKRAILGRLQACLDRLAPAGKETLVEALVRTISYDHRMTVEESELLRAVCASVHCPLPPLIAASQ